MKRFRRGLSLLLTALLAAALLPTAVLAATAKGTTLRLEKTEGDVTLTNENAKVQTISEGMKLYSGDTLATAAKSYAWASLDDAKAVKLDASSKATMLSRGKKLEVRVDSGKLFFDVSVPVASDESFTIKTSTMTTGIRGTAGYQVSTPALEKFCLLHGRTVITVEDPATGALREYDLQAGQALTVTNGAASAPTVSVAPLAAQEVPGFVRKVLAENPALREKVAAATGLPTDELAATADTQLGKDELADAAARQLIEKNAAEENETLARQKQLFEEKAAEDIASGAGNPSGNVDMVFEPPAEEPEDTPALPMAAVTIGYDDNDLDAALAGLQQWLNAPAHSGVVLTVNGEVSITTDNLNSVTVPLGKTLLLKAGDETSGLVLEKTPALTVNGTLLIDGNAYLRIISDGSLVMGVPYEGFANNGTIYVSDGATGTITMLGSMPNRGNVVEIPMG